MQYNIILFGDSDISRWPPSLYPSPPSIDKSTSSINYCNFGVGGATMSDLLQQITDWKAQQQQKDDDTAANRNNINNDHNLFICCAGENDLGGGKSIDSILDTFRSILDVLFPSLNSDGGQQLKSSNNNQSQLIVFIGPKLEPWLTNDNGSRKQYSKLNNGLQRAMRKHHCHTTTTATATTNAQQSIQYIDCLTCFCTDQTANIPGAIYSNRAIPDTKYFTEDGLHFNNVGYALWKEMVEEKMLAILL